MSPSELITALSITPRVILEKLAFTLTHIDPISVGKGEPVVLLPGLGVGERQMDHLRLYLYKCGFDARHWNLGVNLNRSHRGSEFYDLLDEIEEVAFLTGKKVKLVGWSLGGALARLVARERPGLVSKVISVGTPFTGDHRENPIYAIMGLVKNLDADPAVADLYEQLAKPLPYGTHAYSIYSKNDGMVKWQNCVDPKGFTESVAVKGTHVGLMINPQVFRAAAALLAD